MSFTGPVIGKLPAQLYLHWLKFVEANRLLASPYITVENIEAAHKKLLEFCSEMENHYDASAITSNMHFHAHLKEALLDYGPFYVYWYYVFFFFFINVIYRVFNFERYNGDIKNIKTNRKGHFEITYLHKFLATVHGADYLYSRNISEESPGYAILYQLATNNKNNKKITKN